METDEERYARVQDMLRSGKYYAGTDTPNNYRLSLTNSSGQRLDPADMIHPEPVEEPRAQLPVPEPVKDLLTTSAPFSEQIAPVFNMARDAVEWDIQKAGEVMDWAKSKALYRNLFLNDEQKLQDAQKVGTALGLNPQALAENQQLYERAKEIYDKRESREFLQGNPFNDVYKMYPELASMGNVETAIALKNAEDVLMNRQIVNTAADIKNTVTGSAEELWDLMKTGWEAGTRDEQIAETGNMAMRGEITTAEMIERLKALNKEDSVEGLAHVPYDTARTLSSMIGSIRTAAGKYAPWLAGEQRTFASARPFYQGMATMAAGAGGLTAAVGAPLLGAAAALAGIGVTGFLIYESSRDMQAGMNYINLMTKRKPDGTPLYTEEEARTRATSQAVVQGAIETGLMKLAYGPMAKLFGQDAARAIINNAETRNALLRAGKGTIRRMAFKESLKQFGRSAGEEIAEEGAQSLVSSIDENIFGKANDSLGTILSAAAESMVQAVPAAVGLGIPGAAIGGAAMGRRLAKIPKIQLEAAQEAFKRENEMHAVKDLIRERETNKLYKKNPDVYRETIKNQMNRAGIGKIYIDAAAAAETGETQQQALAELVNAGIISAEDLQKSVEDGTQLAVDAGVYMQRIPDAKIAETLSDFTTLNKDGQTMHDIKANQERLKEILSSYEKIRQDKTEDVIRDILERDFPKKNLSEDLMGLGAEAEDHRREAAQDVLYLGRSDRRRSLPGIQTAGNGSHRNERRQRMGIKENLQQRSVVPRLLQGKQKSADAASAL